MTYRIRWMACGLLLLAAACNGATAYDASLLGWRPAPEGTVDMGSLSFNGLDLQLRNEMDFNSDATAWGFAFRAGGDRHQAGIEGLGLSFKGDGAVAYTVAYGGFNLPGYTPVRTEVEVLRIQGHYRFVAGAEKLRGGFLLGVQHLDVTARVRTGLVGELTETLAVPTPVAGLHVEYRPLPQLGVRGSLAAGAMDGLGRRIQTVDAALDARVESPKGLYAGIGYRYARWTGRDRPYRIDVDLRLQGPVAVIGIHW